MGLFLTTNLKKVAQVLLNLKNLQPFGNALSIIELIETALY